MGERGLVGWGGAHEQEIEGASIDKLICTTVINGRATGSSCQRYE